MDKQVFVKGIRVLGADGSGIQIDTEALLNYESVKDKLVCRLVNAERNAESLANMPHTMICDLAVTYCVYLGKKDGNIGAVPITNDLMKRYGVSVEELHRDALKSMDVVLPAAFKSMTDVMVEMMLPNLVRGGVDEVTAEKMIRSQFPDRMGVEMYVLTNKERYRGAAALLSDKAMREVVESIGSDFFILPSSVHEVIIIKPDGDASKECFDSLRQMVCEVNGSCVADNEVLSDNVYVYDAGSHKLRLAGAGVCAQTA